MAAEELLLHDNLAYATKAVILGIVCYVKLRNFYGAMHLIERATKLSV